MNQHCFLVAALMIAVASGGVRADTAQSSSAIDAARALYHAGKNAEAQRAFEAIARAEPANPEPARFLGRLALRQDDPDHAVAWFEKAVALAPTDAESHCALGDSYGRTAQKAGLFAKMGLASKCLASYQRAVAADPTFVRGHESLFGYYVNAPAIAGGGMEKARAEAETLKKLNPARGALAFAQWYQAQKRYPEALAEYDAYLAAAPDDFYVNYQVGKLCDTAHVAPERGLAALRHCLELPPLRPPDAPKHAHAHWRIGNILKAQGDVAGARAAYEAALQVDAHFQNAAEALRLLH